MSVKLNVKEEAEEKHGGKREWLGLKGKGRLVPMEIQKIVHVILCQEISLTWINIQFLHICFVLSTKLQVLQREDLLNIGIRRCSLYYF